MPSLDAQRAGREYWRSLDELAQTPEFLSYVEREFPTYSPEEMRGPSRRQFMKVMGASFALAGMAGCRWPRETILPYAKNPDGRTPGEPVRFATALEVAGFGVGLLATSMDGRPIKIDGNDAHPISRGRTFAMHQASVLSLYDPDRSTSPVSRADGTRRAQSWSAYDGFARTHWDGARAARGVGLCILSEATGSPSIARLRGLLRESLPQARWFEYEPVSWDRIRLGTRLAFDSSVRPYLKLESADVIVSFADDFLVAHPASLAYTREFTARRKASDGTMNRLYVAEGSPTLTGATADHRFRVRPSRMAAAAAQVASALLQRGLSAPAGIAGRLSDFKADALPGDAAAQIAADLLAHRGRSVVTAGPAQPPEVHALVAWMNEALGNAGQTVIYLPDLDPDRPSHNDAIGMLAKDLADGRVDTLLILGGNPVLNAPANSSFAAGIARAKTSIHLSEYEDETSRACTWHVPRAHYLESWADTRSYDGTVSVVQPLIAPLYGGRTPAEILATVLGTGPQTAYEITRATIEQLVLNPESVFEDELAGAAPEIRALFAAAAVAKGTEQGWKEALHLGVVMHTAPRRASPQLSSGGWVDGLLAAAGEAEKASSGFELEFRADYAVFDGRFANNGWLQEMPDPITKLTWDNAALIAPSDARRLGVHKPGDRIRIDLDGASLDLPALILPGQAAGVITLPLGYGRGAAGGVVAEGRGFNVYPLRRSAEFGFATGATVSRSAGWYRLCTTQDHHAIQSEIGSRDAQRRIPELVREATLDEFRHHPDAIKHVVHLPQLKSLWTERPYEGRRWAMAIDLSSCIGCSACVVACQSENNIAVVGKEEVDRGREMHWIRVDRYFRGDAEDPAIVFQPVTCHHCENAPCEQVCPVAATVHDAEGLNVMVYNRCIGTRYCSNNCPYKVRRFNWFFNHYGPKHPRSLKGGTLASPTIFDSPSMQRQKKYSDIERMVLNPEVTVRSRGVMEKCTFCYQRIAAARITARNQWVKSDPERRDEQDHILDGTIRTACQEACPADSIIFGDLNDPNSTVRKWHDNQRSYMILAELNVKPRLAYLGRLRNPAVAGSHGESHEKLSPDHPGPAHG